MVFFSRYRHTLGRALIPHIKENGPYRYIKKIDPDPLQSIIYRYRDGGITIESGFLGCARLQICRAAGRRRPAGVHNIDHRRPKEED